MTRKTFLASLAGVAIGAASGVATAQLREISFDSPYSSSTQQPPVYLKKSLTSARNKERESTEDIEVEIPIDESISRLGQAFHGGDAETLESCLVSGKRKIYLALEIDDPQQGHYGPGQVRHIFARLFRELETRSFVYDTREITRQNGSAVFRADWTYVVLDTDEVVTERLQFKLEEGASDWRIFEVRATSR